jgi:hypothetical protein
MGTVKTVADFVNLAKQQWGAERRTYKQLSDHSLSRIQDVVDYVAATPELKIHLAETIIRESTPNCGQTCENGDARWFLLCAAREMTQNSPLFDVRRLPVIRSALMLLALRDYGMFSRDREYEDLAILSGSGGAALAAKGLLAELEHLFRVKGSYLDSDGKLLKPVPPALAKLNGLKGKKVGQRVNQIQAAFTLYLDGNMTPLAVRLSQLERDIKISDQLELIRPPAMHGPLPDPSVEGLLYGMMVCMFFHSELVP